MGLHEAEVSVPRKEFSGMQDSDYVPYVNGYCNITDAKVVSSLARTVGATDTHAKVKVIFKSSELDERGDLARLNKSVVK